MILKDQNEVVRYYTDNCIELRTNNEQMDSYYKLCALENISKIINGKEKFDKLKELFTVNIGNR